ncbi:MAG: hypothetical protein ACRDS9_10675 [Pseudonocardiaceae bacterium]
MTRDELLALLLLERYTPSPAWTASPWKSTRPRADLDWDDSEITVARRVRDLLAAVDHTKEEEASA